LKPAAPSLQLSDPQRGDHQVGCLPGIAPLTKPGSPAR
jgi:hypothetical protein